MSKFAESMTDSQFAEEQVTKLAFDILSVHAMPAECERTISAAKVMRVSHCNNLSDEVLEVLSVYALGFFVKLGRKVRGDF